MPYPNLLIPIYADTDYEPGQESRAIDWATNRELITADGAPLKATKQGQHRKTIEEIGEALLEVKKLGRTRALGDALISLGLGLEFGQIIKERKHRLALEIGDILVTLCIQSAMHGSTLAQCKFEAGRLNAGYGEDWQLSQLQNPPCTWPYVELWAGHLNAALSDLKAPYRFDALALIGAIALGAEEIARIELAMMGPECLALALDKIEGRQGAIVDGIFVKAGA